MIFSGKDENGNGDVLNANFVEPCIYKAGNKQNQIIPKMFCF